MMLELAIGDAYGAGFEYAEKNFVKTNNTLKKYVRNPKHNDLLPGRYTDDTQMTLAIAELLIDNSSWTPINIATKFVEVFKRDQRPGYAGKFYKFLKEVKSGEEFIEKIIPKSDKSGAAMRSSPIGYIRDIDQVLEYASIQAKLTHNTQEGIASAKAVALMTHYFVHNLGQKKYLGCFIEKKIGGLWDRPWLGEVGSKGYMSVRAAITTVISSSSLEQVLYKSIEFTGDVDTVATIAMAAAACSKEIDKNIPKNLIRKLENKTYGREYLMNLDYRLRQRFKK